jgi:hypothetical protein
MPLLLELGSAHNHVLVFKTNNDTDMFQGAATKRRLSFLVSRASSSITLNMIIRTVADSN